jgi:uncharacterized membrane protein
MDTLQGIIENGQRRDLLNSLFVVETGVLLILLILVIGLFFRKRSFGPHEDEALKILRLRYVNGEITEEQYNHQRDVLLRQD